MQKTLREELEQPSAQVSAGTLKVFPQEAMLGMYPRQNQQETI